MARRTTPRGPRRVPTLTALDPPTATAFFWFLAAAIAIVAALIAIGFRLLLDATTALFLVSIPLALHSKILIFLFLPALGGLLVGILTLTFGPETRGHGVPDILASLQRTGGRLRSRWIGVKALASALSVGSGGSAGREGPIIYMSSTGGSGLAQAFHLPRYPRKVLVACGATAAMSAAFNTPIAAVLFSLELILRELKTQSFIPLVISSVFGTLLSRALLMALGVQSPFIFPPPIYTLVTPWELTFYLALGIICGTLAVIFIRTMKATDTFFHRLSSPQRRWGISRLPTSAQIILKPALGGLIVGALGVLLIFTVGAPYVFGVGYNVIHLVLTVPLSLILIASLAILKILATSVTIESGGSGGVFSSLFFIGTMTGAAFGLLLHLLVPFGIADYQAYAIVGMAAFFAGSTRATLTAILMVFEMTGNYLIILPLMFACVISDGVSNYLSRDTIFTMNLAQRGVLIEHDMGVSRIKTRTAADVMRTTIPSLPPNGHVRDACPIIQTHRSPGYPILIHNKFLGFISRDDLMDALIAENLDQPLAPLIHTPTFFVPPTMPLDQVLEEMNRENTNYLAVTPPDQPTKLLGVVTRNDLLKVFEREPWEE